MLPIGAYICIWTTLLLLCISTLAQATNETSSVEATSTPSSTLPSPSIQSSFTATAPALRHSPNAYTSETSCGFRTINYITHTLPQQCLKTSWSASNRAEVTPAEEGVASGTPASERTVESIANSQTTAAQNVSTTEPPNAATDTSAPTEAASSTVSVEPELETDSPLDNANFLSFEEWKKQNLAQAGQSPDNVGQRRGASGNSEPRRRPGSINNALDALGEDSEIELDFGGFGNTGQGDGGSSGSPSRASGSQDPSGATEGEGNAAPSSWALGKDAGKTCKERFNYASFDCAATVLKTNPRCKSSSSVLVENKDSYMLNECSTQNKFLIVELCDDILVDTIVLANFEFFSSMVRHFRVSVSDRYPVKMDRWRTLGTFEARNSRDIQAFLVKEPQIWARYLRVEFLTHYGNEFYCPVSLLRLHGTTMMDEFKRQEEEARGDYEFEQPIEEAQGEPVITAAPIVEAESSKAIDEKALEEARKTEQPASERPEQGTSVTPSSDPTSSSSHPSQLAAEESPSHSRNHSTRTDELSNAIHPSADQTPSQNASMPLPKPLEAEYGNATASKGKDEASKTSTAGPSSQTAESSTGFSKDSMSGDVGSVSSVASKKSANSTTSGVSGTASSKSSTNATNTASEKRQSSQVQPPPANPTTQESFFKSITKRLQHLEANSTLSLQYIEEQSRILRDAFTKVEKRQLTKTETFLNHLNSSVMQELKSYRSMYDQLWQSTILELESMKERNQREIGEIGARLGLVADELVWQKRMAVVQSTLLLLCLGLVLFVRSGTLGSQLDVPIVQQLGSRYARMFDTPPGSPDASGRRRKGFRSMWRSDTSGTSGSGIMRSRSGHLSDGYDANRTARRGMDHLSSDAETDGRRSPIGTEFSPPTPTTGNSDSALHSSPDTRDYRNGDKSEIDTPTVQVEDTDDLKRPPLLLNESEQAHRVQVLATQSGPATPLGSRDSRPSWEEVERAVDALKAEVDADGESIRPTSTLSRSASYGVGGEDGVDAESDNSGPSDEGLDGTGLL